MKDYIKSFITNKVKLKWLTFFIVLLVFTINTSLTFGNTEEVFKQGESLRYRVRYLWVLPVGTIELKINKIFNEASRQEYNFLLTAQTPTFLRSIFWAKLKAESIWDKSNKYSLYYKEELERKGKEKKVKELTFQQRKHIMSNIDGHKIKIFPHSQDPVSLVYYIRTLDFQEGKAYHVYFNGSKRNYRINLEVIEKEPCYIANKSYDCFKIKMEIFKIKFNGKERYEGRGYLLITQKPSKVPLQLRIMTKYGPLNLTLLGTPK